MPRKPTGVRRTEIVDAATRIIATRGARKFTAQLLASEVGVTPGAIFRHFESMGAIVDAVVDRMEAMLSADFPPEAGEPLARLRLFFEQRVRTILAEPHLSRMLLSDHLAQAGGRRQAARVEALKARSRAFLLTCLREAERRGQLRNGVHAEAGAVLVMGAVLALSHGRAHAQGAGRIEVLAAHVWRTLEGGLVEQPAQRARSHGRLSGHS